MAASTANSASPRAAAALKGDTPLMRRVASQPLLPCSALALFYQPACRLSAGARSADRLITNKAVDTLPPEMLPFFDANRQFLVQHVTDPESGEQSTPTSTTASSGSTTTGSSLFPRSRAPIRAAVCKFTRRTVEMYGLLPWQIGIYSKKLTDAFEARNWTEAKLTAAILAYYVAAAHDPFNTTMNHDGSLSDQPGVNERFGAGLVDRYQLFFFVKPNEAAFIRDPTEHAFDMRHGRPCLA